MTMIKYPRPLTVTTMALLASVLTLATPFTVHAEEGVPLTSIDKIDPMVVARGLSSSFEKVATQITPSVVNIVSTKRPERPANNRRGGPRPGLPNDPFFDQFRDFFGEDFPGFQFRTPDDEGSGQGLGTGVIVDERGYILTNNHVIGDADEVTVRLHDQSTFKAEVIGKDPRTDVAVIRIKAKDLAPARLGNSDELKIGEWVVAAGNPFGLDNSITAGIVSAKGRSIMGGGQYEDFIQTDAAINPGNSGGPLVNLKGEVVGINTAIFSRSGGYMGIGFAIPINMAKTVMDGLIKDGRVVRGWLGVAIQNLTEELANSFNHTSTDGALVGDVQDDGPSKGILRQGDIIIEFNGQKIKNVNQLRNLVAAIGPGTSVALGVIRDGRKESVNLTLGELPANTPGESGAPSEDADETAEALGIAVENLTTEMARRLNSKRSKGVVVTRVAPGSLGQTAGLQQRDIIVSVNGSEVGSVAEFRKLTSPENLKKGVRLVVESDGMTRFVILRVQ